MKTDWVIIILLFICVLAIGYFFVFEFKKPSVECLNDPLVYGAKQLEYQNNYPVMCSCSLLTPYPSPRLSFDPNGRRFEDKLILGE